MWRSFPYFKLTGWLIILLAHLPANAQVDSVYPCLDTLKMRDMYRDGHVREALNVWRNFKTKVIRERLNISKDCMVLSSKYIGVLEIVLNKDTATAQDYFAYALRRDRERELWEYDMPFDAQNYWDNFREVQACAIPFKSNWENGWLPPLKYSLNPNASLIQTRRLYFQNRRLFAIANNDPLKFIQVLNNSAEQSDPAFKIMHASASFKIGVNPDKILDELLLIMPQNSSLVTEENLNIWLAGMEEIVKERKNSLGSSPATPKVIPHTEIKLRSTTPSK